VARLTVDLMRPVPVAPLTLAVEVLREGKKIQLVSARLLATAPRSCAPPCCASAARARAARSAFTPAHDMRGPETSSDR
jgi:hypothetical protein